MNFVKNILLFEPPDFSFILLHYLYNKKINRMNQQALHIIKSPVFKWPVIFLLILFISILVYFSSIKDIVIFPASESYKYDTYTDKPNGGNSQILKQTVTDSVLILEFLLKEGFQSPYIGLSISPSENKYINVRKYNVLNVSIRGINIDRVGISFFTPPLTYDDPSNNDEALYHSYLNISDLPITYHLKFKQFRHPEWWEDLHHMPKALKNSPDLKHILHVNIGSAYSPGLEMEKSLEIRSIVFSRNNRVLFLIMTILFMSCAFIYFGILYLIASRKLNYSNITVSYKPLEISDNRVKIEKCIAFINTNYQNSELSLEIIAKETAFTPRRITSIIHNHYRCNFKTYLNRIRINESKRFLVQTDLNIGEIAFKVGFNNQSHFNRVFKSELGLSPTEYRDNHKA